MMATLAQLYPDCVQNWIDPEDGDLIPSVEYECVWRHIVRAGTKVIETKDDVRDAGKVVAYNEQDSGHVLIRVKGRGWWAIAEGKPGVARFARSLV
jgi:hypothetical protein